MISGRPVCLKEMSREELIALARALVAGNTGQRERVERSRHVRTSAAVIGRSILGTDDAFR